jgi:hypothetical protein
MILHVLAGRADEAHRGMASQTELAGFRIIVPAFSTFHGLLPIARSTLLSAKAGFYYRLAGGFPSPETKRSNVPLLVDAKGFEPSTSALRTPRSPN